MVLIFSGTKLTAENEREMVEKSKIIFALTPSLKKGFGNFALLNYCIRLRVEFK